MGQICVNLVSGFTDRNKMLLNHCLSLSVEVVGKDVKRKCLELWAKNVGNSIGKYDVPEQQGKQCPNSCAFPMHP